MVMLASIIPSLEEVKWFAALQCARCFHPSHRRFLSFLVGQEHYQFRVLLFGLAAVPKNFMKVFSVVAAQMR